MIRSYNFDDDVVALLDAQDKGDRSKLARKAMRIGLQQLGHLPGNKREEYVDENLLGAIREIVKKEIKGLQVAPETEERVNNQTQAKVRNLTRNILGSRR